MSRANRSYSGLARGCSSLWLQGSSYTHSSSIAILSPTNIATSSQSTHPSTFSHGRTSTPRICHGLIQLRWSMPSQR